MLHPGSDQAYFNGLLDSQLLVEQFVKAFTTSFLRLLRGDDGGTAAREHEVRLDRKRRRNYQWEHIENLLPGKISDPGRMANDNRRLVEAVFWIMRTGSPWRDLPAEYGHWHRTYVRFARWRESGARKRVADALRGDADMAYLFIDSTIVRAHQYSAGTQKKREVRKSADRVEV